MLTLEKGGSIYLGEVGLVYVPVFVVFCICHVGVERDG